MMLSLALIVFPSAIALLFAQEFSRLTQKLMAIPGVKFLVPILLASWLIEQYQDWGRWILLYTQVQFYNLIQNTMELLPFKSGSETAVRVVFLFFLGSFPGVVSWLKTKRSGLYAIPMYSYYISAVLWGFASLVLII